MEAKHGQTSELPPCSSPALPPGQLGLGWLYIFGVVHKERVLLSEDVQPVLYLTGHHLRGTRGFRDWGEAEFGVSSSWQMAKAFFLSTGQEVAVSFPDSIV